MSPFPCTNLNTEAKVKIYNLTGDLIKELTVSIDILCQALFTEVPEMEQNPFNRLIRADGQVLNRLDPISAMLEGEKELTLTLLKGPDLRHLLLETLERIEVQLSQNQEFDKASKDKALSILKEFKRVSTTGITTHAYIENHPFLRQIHAYIGLSNLVISKSTLPEYWSWSLKWTLFNPTNPCEIGLAVYPDSSLLNLIPYDGSEHINCWLLPNNIMTVPDGSGDTRPAISTD